MKSKIFEGFYKNLAEIGEFVVEASRGSGLSEKDIYSVQLAVDEACTNIIEHGYGGEGKGIIECTCIQIEGGIEIILRDEAEHFDPTTLPEVNVGVPLEQLELRGAGVFLMKKVMDEITFEFLDGKGTKLKMVKNKGA